MLMPAAIGVDREDPARESSAPAEDGICAPDTVLRYSISAITMRAGGKLI